jgi:hypothetical protein
MAHFIPVLLITLNIALKNITGEKELNILVAVDL